MKRLFKHSAPNKLTLLIRVIEIQCKNKMIDKTRRVILLAMFIGAFSIQCLAQNPNANGFHYKKVLDSYRQRAYIPNKLLAEAHVAQDGSYDLANSLPSDYVKDGTEDYTSYLQKGLNEHDKVVFPDFPILVNSAGLSIKSNSNLVFQRNSRLKLKATNNSSYKILNINNVQNVKIFFPYIQGDRKIHIGNGGEWGMGISIVSSSNIQIIGPKVIDCWGDGIYLGENNSGANKNILISYAQLDNNRRNGISVISVDGLDLICPVVTNTNGTAPMAGIDIEPNTNRNEINNINIDSAITFNNSNYGIVLELDKLSGKDFKNVNVKIQNHSDYGSGNGMCFYLPQKTSKASFGGTVSIVNPVWQNNSKDAFKFFKSYRNGLKVEFSNIKVLKSDENGKQSSDNKKLLNTTNTIKKELNATVN